MKNWIKKLFETKTDSILTRSSDRLGYKLKEISDKIDKKNK